MAAQNLFVYLMLKLFLLHIIEGQGVLKDVRLVNGTMTNEGIVIYTEDCETWKTACGGNLGINEVIVFCRHLGFAGGNRALKDPPFNSTNISPASSIHCGTGEGTIENCTVSSGCSNPLSSPGGAVCYGSNYLGCFVDNSTYRVLKGPNNTTFTELTINECIKFCRQQSNMRFAGVEYRMECYCGDGASNYSRYGRVSDNQCHVPCVGSQTESCGGSGHIAIFDITTMPDYSPSPMYSCDMTTPKTSIASLDMFQPTSSTDMTESVSSLSSITQQPPMASKMTQTASSPESISREILNTFTDTIGIGSTVRVTTPAVTSASSQTTSSPTGNTIALYAGIGGGVAGLVLLCIIIIALVFTCKSRRKDDGNYDMKNLASLENKPPVGYDNAIVTFPEVPQGDTLPRDIKDEQGGEVAKDSFTAQMKRGTMLVEDVGRNEKNRPKVASKPDAALRVTYHKAGGSKDKRANSTSEPKDLEGLYAMSTKNRPEPYGGDCGDLYAMPDKSRKSKMSHDALGQPSAEDEGDLYAMPDKNKNSKLSPSVPVFTGNVDAMYAMPDKQRFRNENDGDSTEMVENELYGLPGN